MYSFNVKYNQCDKIGENEDFERSCRQEGMGIQFKYTMPGAPQQNGLVGRKFATLFDRLCAMLDNGKFSSFLRNGLCAEAANLSTLFESNLLASLRFKMISAIFWKEKEKNSLLWHKKLVKYALWSTEITHINQNWPIKAHQEYGWFCRWTSSCYLPHVK